MQGWGEPVVTSAGCSQVLQGVSDNIAVGCVSVNRELSVSKGWSGWASIQNDLFTGGSVGLRQWVGWGLVWAVKEVCNLALNEVS